MEALAGFVGVNEILGGHPRLLLDFALGYGFGGIAVALMGRNHPLGIALAGLLFGVLQQGGTELSFEMPQINREMERLIRECPQQYLWGYGRYKAPRQESP